MDKQDTELSITSNDKKLTQRGTLKIFFGMCPGVGKTHAMLNAARQSLDKGVDVVIGYLESNRQSELDTLSKGIDSIPYKNHQTAEGIITKELDLDAIISRHPYLVLIENLAYNNPSNARHTKRYQDILELLDNGINIYTTLNIQNIESRSDIITKITGLTLNETIPDDVFENADEVELIDVSVKTVLSRFAENKIDNTIGTQADFVKFFRRGNLTALREMALRIVADKVDKEVKTYMKKNKIEGPWKSGMHLLVLVGPSKSSAKLIRLAKNLSYTTGADLIALHVETTSPLTEEQQEQLSKNLDLARQFGAEIIITSGNDLVSSTLEVARRENITHLIIGKSGKQSFLSSLLRKDDFVNRLLKESGDIDIYVIEPGFEAKQYKKKLISDPELSSPTTDYIWTSLIVIASVFICLPISTFTGYQSVSFILLFVVLILSMYFRQGPIILASAISAIAWNFFFIPPHFTIKINHPEDMLAICMFFIVAFVTGSLTSRVRKQVRLTKRREERTNALFHLTSNLAKVSTSKDILETSRSDIKKYFGVDSFFFLQDTQGVLKSKQPKDKQKSLSASEYEVAQWVYRHKKKAGKFTDTLSSNEYTFYPLIGTNTKPGVIVIRMNVPFSSETELFWNIFLTQISNTLEHHQFVQIAQKSSASEVSDKLLNSFFKSIETELSKPVSTIVDISQKLITLTDTKSKESLHTQIHKETLTLKLATSNLLNTYEIENGRIFSKFDWHDIKAIFDSVTKELATYLAPFCLDIVIPDNMPLVKIDGNQIEQVLANLLINSTKYSKEGTTIRLKSFYDNGNLIIQEMDRGVGFNPRHIPLAFSKFHKDDLDGKANSFGIGLYVAKGLVEAHQGCIAVENRQNGGSRFTIKIPTEILFEDKNKQ